MGCGWPIGRCRHTHWVTHRAPIVNVTIYLFTLVSSAAALVLALAVMSITLITALLLGSPLDSVGSIHLFSVIYIIVFAGHLGFIYHLKRRWQHVLRSICSLTRLSHPIVLGIALYVVTRLKARLQRRSSI